MQLSFVKAVDSSKSITKAIAYPHHPRVWRNTMSNPTNELMSLIIATKILEQIHGDETCLVSDLANMFHTTLSNILVKHDIINEAPTVECIEIANPSENRTIQ